MQSKNRTTTQHNQPASPKAAENAATSSSVKLAAMLMSGATVEDRRPPLISLPLHRALIEKYRAGRAGREHLPFQGDALPELYEELLDGLNYCDQLEIEGRLPQFTPSIRGLLLELEAKVREAYGVERQARMLAFLENERRA